MNTSKGVHHVQGNNEDGTEILKFFLLHPCVCSPPCRDVFNSRQPEATVTRRKERQKV